MMITGLRIGNFKAFGQTQHVPIRPLTLIFGANSSGKSSLIHALLLAHHAIETGELDVHRTTIGGDSVDLGGFRQYVYGHKTDSQTEWVAEISTVDLGQKLSELLPGAKKVSVGLTIELSGISKGIRDIAGHLTLQQVDDALTEGKEDEETDTSTSSSKSQKRMLEKKKTEKDLMTLKELSIVEGNVHVETFWLEVDGARLLSMEYKKENYLQLGDLGSQSTVITEIIKARLRKIMASHAAEIQDIEDVERIIEELTPSISFELGNFLPKRLKGDESRTELFKRMSDLINGDNEKESIKKAIKLFLPEVIDDIVTTVSRMVEEKIKKLIYLGPLRSYPPRLIDFSQHHDASWRPEGADAWDILRKNPQVLSDVNKWLGDGEKLSTAYELKVRNLVTLEDIKPIYEQLMSQAVNNVLFRKVAEAKREIECVDESGEIEEAIGEVSEQVKMFEPLLPSVQQLVLFDKRTKTVVSHRDVGIGISQVLPVLVNAFAPSQSIIAIEQPEIHLHPALQAELGDLFIQSALGEQQNTFLLETHSEHLILRIMRRMRETANGTLPTGLPPVRPEDVSIIYVQRKDSASIVRVLELDREGQLLDPWPGGFFEEGFRERFS